MVEEQSSILLESSYCTLKETGLLVPAEVLTAKLAVCRGAFFVTATCAVMVVELTTTTFRTETWLPETAIFAPEVKLVPVKVTLVVLPRSTAFGDTEERVGLEAVGADADALTANAWAPVVPALVLTETPSVPVEAEEPIESTAWICEALRTLTPLTVTPDPPTLTAAPD